MAFPAPPQTEQSRLAEAQAKFEFAKRLQALSNTIHATESIAQIMIDHAPEICDLFKCERLTLYAVNKERGVLVSKVKTGINSNQDLVLPISKQSIAGYVALTRSTVRINDLNDAEELRRIDPELQFANKVDEVTGYRSKTMLAAPLLRLGIELVGVLQLINQRDDGHFSSVSEYGLEQLSAVLALAFSQRIKAGALLPKQYEALTEHGVISAQELELAQRWAQRKNKDLEQVLVDDFRIPLAAIGQALAKQAELPYQPFEASWKVDTELAKKLDRIECEKSRWLPHSREGNRLTVVSTDPDKTPARIGKIGRAFPYAVIALRYTTQTDFDLMHEKYFPAAQSKTPK